MNHNEIIEELANVVGADHVKPGQPGCNDPAAAPAPPQNGWFSVAPGNAGDVQRIVLYAIERKLGLANRVFPMAGHHFHHDHPNGCILLDLHRMDRIIEVNEDACYALIEPGVTEEMLARCLDRDFPGFQHNKSLGPANGSVTANALMSGTGTLSYRFGNSGDMINGLEVVLPTGEICNIGSSALGRNWFSPGPVPGLNGLFLNWPGSTGVVTKMSYRLYPGPELGAVLVRSISEPGHLPEIISSITHTELADQIMVANGDRSSGITVKVVISGDTREELEFKEKYLGWGGCTEEIFHWGNENRGGVSGFSWPPGGNGISTHGIEWHAVLPIEAIPGVWAQYARLSDTCHATPRFFLNVQDQGHQVYFALFLDLKKDASPPAEEILAGLGQVAAANGGVPALANAFGGTEMPGNMNPGFKDLMEKIQQELDPHGIMDFQPWENRKNV